MLRKAVDQSFSSTFQIYRSTGFSPDMFIWYLNESSLHAESENVIIILIEVSPDISVFGTGRVKPSLMGFFANSFSANRDNSCAKAM